MPQDGLPGSADRALVGIGLVGQPTPLPLHRAQLVGYYHRHQNSAMASSAPPGWPVLPDHDDADLFAGSDEDVPADISDRENHDFNTRASYGEARIPTKASGVHRLSTLTMSLAMVGIQESERHSQLASMEPDDVKSDQGSLESRDIDELGSLHSRDHQMSTGIPLTSDDHHQPTRTNEDYLDTCFSSESSIEDEDRDFEHEAELGDAGDCENPGLDNEVEDHDDHNDEDPFNMISLQTLRKDPPILGQIDSQTFSFQADTVDEVIARERERSPLRKVYRTSLYRSRSGTEKEVPLLGDVGVVDNDKLDASEFVRAVDFGETPSKEEVDEAFEILEKAGAPRPVIDFLIHRVFKFYVERVEAAEDSDVGDDGVERLLSSRYIQNHIGRDSFMENYSPSGGGRPRVDGEQGQDSSPTVDNRRENSHDQFLGEAEEMEGPVLSTTGLGELEGLFRMEVQNKLIREDMIARLEQQVSSMSETMTQRQAEHRCKELELEERNRYIDDLERELSRAKLKLEENSRILTERAQEVHVLRDDLSDAQRDNIDLRSQLDYWRNADVAKVSPLSRTEETMTDGFLRRLSATLNHGLKESAKIGNQEKLLGRIEQLMEERTTLISFSDELKREIEGQSGLLDEMRNDFQNKQLLFEQEIEKLKNHYENEIKLLRQRSLPVEEGSELTSAGDCSVSHLEPEDALENSLDLTWNSVEEMLREKSSSLEHARELIQNVMSLLKREDEGAKIDEMVDKLGAVLDAHDEIIMQMDQDRKALETRKVLLRYDEENVRIFQTHIEQLRGMWVEELNKNTELRNALFQATSAPTGASAGDRDVEITGLRSTIANMERRLENRENEWAVVQQRVVQVLSPAVSRKFDELEGCDRVEAMISELANEHGRIRHQLGQCQKRIERIEGRSENLCHQKMVLLWSFALNGSCPPHIQISNTVMSFRNRFRVAVLASRLVTRLRAAIQTSGGVYGQIAAPPLNYAFVPSPSWSSIQAPSLSYALAQAALPKMEEALAKSSGRIAELESALASLQSRLADVETRDSSNERLNGGAMAALSAERSSLVRSLRAELAEARADRVQLQRRYDSLRAECEDLQYRLTDEQRIRLVAENRVERFEEKISDRDRRIHALVEAHGRKEKHYRSAITKLKSQIAALVGPANEALGGEIREAQKVLDRVFTKEIRGKENLSDSKGDGAGKRLASIVTERQEQAREFLTRLIDSAEGDLKQLGGNNHHVCTSREKLRHQIEGLRRAARKLESFKI